MIGAGVVEAGPDNEFTVNVSQSPSKFKPFDGNWSLRRLNWVDFDKSSKLFAAAKRS